MSAMKSDQPKASDPAALSDVIRLLESAVITIEERVRTWELLSRIDVHEKNVSIGMLRGARLEITKSLKSVRAALAASVVPQGWQPIATAPNKQEKHMVYEVVRSRSAQDEWAAEAIDDDGACYVTLFSGPNAQQRAEEYAAWKMQAALPSPPPQESKP